VYVRPDDLQRTVTVDRQARVLRVRQRPWISHMHSSNSVYGKVVEASYFAEAQFATRQKKKQLQKQFKS